MASTRRNSKRTPGKDPVAEAAIAAAKAMVKPFKAYPGTGWLYFRERNASDIVISARGTLQLTENAQLTAIARVINNRWTLAVYDAPDATKPLSTCVFERAGEGRGKATLSIPGVLKNARVEMWKTETKTSGRPCYRLSIPLLRDLHSTAAEF